jgi:PAS domain S-box-containing protein
MATYENGSEHAAIEQERLKSLINSMADGVLALDDSQNIVLYNGAALDVLDINGSLEGKQVSSVLRLFDTHNQPLDVSSLISGPDTSRSYRDYHMVYSDNSTVNLYISIAPVRLGYGQQGTKGYVVILRDITREKSLEEERDEFIGVVSHELRTPITIAEGNLSNAVLMAQKTGDMTLVMKALHDAHEQIIFLADMINDLATLSRAERGKLTYEIEEINMPNLMQELVDSYQMEAQKKNISLSLELDPKLEILRSSKLYVHEILQNFITNAIKYTDEGSVRVEVTQLTKGVRCSVHDSGIGISKQDQQKIFDKFFRSEDYRTRKHSGTGLGLYVSFKLLRLVKGDVDVQSELDKGSVFTVTFPNL